MDKVQIVDLLSAPDLSLLGGSVCTFGVFDGLHMGHKEIFNTTVKLAKELNTPAIALTFDIDPDEIFKLGHLKLMSNEQRLQNLSNAGFDKVIAFRFNQDFASISADDFLELLFSGNIPAAIVVGEDFRFGNKGAGNVDMLRKWGRTHNMQVVEIPLLEHDGAPVKSTRIRELLKAGDTASAQQLLGLQDSGV